MTDKKTPPPLPIEPPYAIIGLGIVGGSIAKALRERYPKIEIIGFDTDAEVRAAAKKKRVVNRALEPVAGDAMAEALSASNAVFICAPLGSIEGLLEAIAPNVQDALVTDVAGVKAPVLRMARKHLGATRFVGSHPMAGGTHGGYGASRPDLFERMPVAICPDVEDDPATCREVAALWQAMGAVALPMSVDEHDRIVARTSHVPYLTAIAHTLSVAELPRPLTGRGFATAAHHAAFDPAIMAAVCRANGYLSIAVRDMAERLRTLADLLDRDPAAFDAMAEEARVIYRKLADTGGRPFELGFTRGMAMGDERR